MLALSKRVRVLQEGTDPRSGNCVYVRYETQFAETPDSKPGPSNKPSQGAAAAAGALDSAAAAAALGIGQSAAKRAAADKGSKSGGKAATATGKAAAGSAAGSGAATKKVDQKGTGTAPKKTSKAGKRKNDVRPAAVLLWL